MNINILTAVLEDFEHLTVVRKKQQKKNVKCLTLVSGHSITMRLLFTRNAE